MKMAIDTIFQQLEGLGFFDYLLPFVLIFAIIFAILEKVKLFGEDKSNIHLIISIVIGMLFTTQMTIVQRMTEVLLPKISFFIVLVFLFLILIGLLGADVSAGLKGTPFFAAVLVCLFALWWALGDDFGLSLPVWMQNTEWWGYLLTIGVLIGMVFFVKKTKAGKATVGNMYTNAIKGLRGED